MEIWKFGNREVWKQGNMEIGKYGFMEIWEYRNREIGKFGNLANLKTFHGFETYASSSTSYLLTETRHNFHFFVTFSNSITN